MIRAELVVTAIRMDVITSLLEVITILLVVTAILLEVITVSPMLRTR